MILSVHIPKTAGTSLRQGFAAAYGDRLMLDYDNDRPLSTGVPQAWRRWRHRRAVRRRWPALVARYAVIHGHFQATKYAFAGGSARFACFLRDPATQGPSLYAHFKRHPDPANTLSQKLVRADWSLETFLRQPEVAGLYDLFLDGVPLEAFAFVGITERYAESIALFNRIFEADVPVAAANTAPEPLSVETRGLEGASTANGRIYQKGLRRFDALYRRYFPGGV